jgi:hypothetical protein
MTHNSYMHIEQFWDVEGNFFKKNNKNSVIFNNMLYGKDNVDKYEFKIDNVDYESFFQLIKYIYTSNSSMITDDNCMKLLKAADSYGVDGLKLACFDFLVNRVDKDTCCTMLLKAQNGEYEFAAKELISKCIGYLEKHAMDIIESDVSFVKQKKTNIFFCRDGYNLMKVQ